MAQWLRAQVWFPAPVSHGSWVSVTPATGDMMLWPAWIPAHACTYIPTHTYMEI